MALAQYSELYWFPSGSVAANVTARVFVYSTNTLATLYADAGGVTPLANPLLTSGTGRLEFYAEEGRYWVHIDSEAFEIAVGAAAQPATQQDIADEVMRADAAYAPILHAASHAAAGTDPVTLTQAQITGLAAALAALAPLAGATFTGAVTVDGAALNVTGYTTLAGAQANGDFTVFGIFQAAGSALFSAYPSGPGTAPTLGVQLVDKTYTDVTFATQATVSAIDAFVGDLLNRVLNIETGTAFLAGANFTAPVLVHNTRVEIRDGGANPLHRLDGAANTLGFHGATPVTQQNVTGSRISGAALVSLLTALDNLGLITDSTTL